MTNVNTLCYNYIGYERDGIKMIYLLQEKIFKNEELKNYNLRELRKEVSEQLNWLFTTENYDSKKVKNLMANEKKINKLILKEMI